MITPLPMPISPFLSLTLHNGQPLDIPASSVVTVEQLNDDEKTATPGARSGVFFDLGNGPQAVLVVQPFPKLEKEIAPALAGAALVLERPNGCKVLLRKSNIRGIMGLPDGDAKCQVSHQVGPRTLGCNVINTRDEIMAQIAPPAPQEVPTNASETDAPQG